MANTPFVSLFLLLSLIVGAAVLWYPFEPKWDELPPVPIAPIVFFDDDSDTGIYRLSGTLEHVVVCEGIEVFRFYCGDVP